MQLHKILEPKEHECAEEAHKLIEQVLSPQNSVKMTDEEFKSLDRLNMWRLDKIFKD